MSQGQAELVVHGSSRLFGSFGCLCLFFQKYRFLRVTDLGITILKLVKIFEININPYFSLIYLLNFQYSLVLLVCV